jgi:hypothetical protein
MLTPLGRGGRRAHRRHWRRVLAVVGAAVLVAALVGGGWLWRSDGTDTPTARPTPSPTQTCRTPPPPQRPTTLPDPSQVEIEVLNGSSRPGLALTTADDLANRGFVVLGYDNSPLTPRADANVRYVRSQLAAAVSVASYLPGAQLKPVKPSSGPTTVVVVLGEGFSKVRTTAQAQAAAASVPLPVPSPICRK